ncbi:MAG: NADH:ubiquinone reductase (Na(+)-transporting) subunit B [Planctomycetaceae bacterium]|nr:NADH:ubiquinone reductase (Na(+)-transporting) subunit B [Planctomycetaceae bacterium]
MKPLRKFLDSLEPTFKEGKLKSFYPLYEAADTFLYTPGQVTPGPSHVRDAMDLKRMMSTVVVALGPCIVMAMYNTGLQANLALQRLVEAGQITQPAAMGWRAAVLEGLPFAYDPGSILGNLLHGALYFIPVYLVTQIAGGSCEAIFASVRKHEINEGFLVTGMLFPLTLPPTIPLWQVAIGIIFGVVIGKEVFGGTGKNFLNPALTARAFLYFAYPASMAGDTMWVAVDGLTAATPLGAMATAPIALAEGATNVPLAVNMQAVTEGLQISWSQAFLGTIPGSMGETSTLCCLFGALVLIGTGVGSWRIMLAVLLGGFLSAWGFWSLRNFSDNPMFHMTPMWHLVTGGFAFGLVFMATDPVSAAMTNTGKWAYGALVGVTTTLVRVINPGYPEGIMLAILLGNVFAPLIDYVVVQANIKRRQARSAR